MAICDSPLSLSILYSQSRPYFKEIVPLVRKLESLFPNTYNIFVQRVKPYSKFGRYQEEEQAKGLDQQAMQLLSPIHLGVTGDESGAVKAVSKILEHLKEPK